MHSQLQGLPAVVHAILPELKHWNLAEETLADCSRCVMRPRNGEAPQPWHFNARTECCTHHPFLANYLVGRALRRMDVGSERVRQRLHVAEGRTERGLQPTAAYHNRYQATKTTSFGHDESLICPFREPGPLSCSIWQNRNSTCRTWFCKSSTGLPAKLTWTAVRDVLARVEIDLANYCAQSLPAPDPTASVNTWEAWFIRCADLIDGMTADEALDVRSDRLDGLIAVVDKRCAQAERSDLPDVLVPSVGTVNPNGEHIRLTGYSPYDATTLPSHIFSFLSHLDGTSTWQDAAQRCFDATGFLVDSTIAIRLYALRIIRTPQSNDDPYSPEVTSPHQLIVHS